MLALEDEAPPTLALRATGSEVVAVDFIGAGQQEEKDVTCATEFDTGGQLANNQPLAACRRLSTCW